MDGNNYPPEIIRAAQFVLENEPRLKAAKDLLDNYVKEHGTILDQEHDIKVMQVVRQLKSLNEEKMTDYRRDKVIAGITINRANVLKYAKTEDLEKAGYTPEKTPELYDFKQSVSVKVSSIPAKERRI